MIEYGVRDLVPARVFQPAHVEGGFATEEEAKDWMDHNPMNSGPGDFEVVWREVSDWKPVEGEMR